MKIIVKEADFIYKNHRCVIYFRRDGYRTGYVSFDKEYDDNLFDYLFYNISCHGGISYYSYKLPYLEENNKFKSFIGFDCCHVYDETDIEQTIEYFGTRPNNIYIGNGRIKRDLPFCIKECYKLVNQLIVEERKENM